MYSPLTPFFVCLRFSHVSHKILYQELLKPESFRFCVSVVLSTPHCRQPEAGPSVMCRGQTGRCQLFLSGGRSETPGFDTELHKSPPHWRHWLQASYDTGKRLKRLTKVVLRKKAGLLKEIQARWFGLETGYVALPNLFDMQGQRWAGCGGHS